ncbi:MAG TPA: hypothetical protein IAA98_13570 [Candidatus Avipropionibacterium avicola]|uniref:Uncharacterized protein n=1 Tax=Candidatus Avipropionibacterium avicola TaxID=2840701 RepID=A0A9D1KP89_9ACTN|nr:hypothetical protein [Candidatus Avipropionibacterium avicola]
MILIWRGWGVVSALLALAGLAAGGAIGAGSMLGIGMGTGLFLGGAIGAVLGHWLNVIRPAGEIEQARKNIEQDLWSRVQAGQFQVAPGVPAPQTEAEAEQQVATVVGQYDKDLAKMRNRNTLFWIPMQFASAGLAVIGLVVMAISAFGMVTG